MAKRHRVRRDNRKLAQRARTRQVEAEAVEDRVGLGDPSMLLGGVVGAENGGTIEAQAARLGDARLPTVQRRALAVQIGRLQGNRHLQRVMASLNKGEKRRSPFRKSRSGQGVRCGAEQRRGAASSIVQRRLEYRGRATGAEADSLLAAFDASVLRIEGMLRGVTGDEADVLREALARLRALRAAGRVTCWHISGGRYYAVYDNASGELRLNVNFRSMATVPGTLMHEAVHAVHAAEYPRLSRIYGEVLAAGGTRDTDLGVLLLKWKAWTEYWAYRRAVEYDNLRREPDARRDVHEAAMGETDVERSIARVEAATGESFEPWTWSPPRAYRARSR